MTVRRLSRLYLFIYEETLQCPIWRSRLVRWIHMGLVNTFGACCHHLLLKTTFVANWKKTPQKWHFSYHVDLGVPNGRKWVLGYDFVWNPLRCEFCTTKFFLFQTPLLRILRVPENGSHEKFWRKMPKIAEKSTFLKIAQEQPKWLMELKFYENCSLGLKEAKKSNFCHFWFFRPTRPNAWKICCRKFWKKNKNDNFSKLCLEGGKNQKWQKFYFLSSLSPKEKIQWTFQC